MKKLALALTALVGMGGLLTTGPSIVTSPAQAAPAQPAGRIDCDRTSANLEVKHRAPVHTRPSGKSPVSFVVSAGKVLRIGGYCDNSAGNRWYCFADCGISEGNWIWEEYFLD